MAYTTIDDPAQYFNTVLFTGDIQDSDGTGHDQAITGVGWQPKQISETASAVFPIRQRFMVSIHRQVSKKRLIGLLINRSRG